jgi:hypothetical protein
MSWSSSSSGSAERVLSRCFDDEAVGVSRVSGSGRGCFSDSLFWIGNVGGAGLGEEASGEMAGVVGVGVDGREGVGEEAGDSVSRIDAGRLATRGATGVPSAFCVAMPPSADNPALSL